MKDRLLEKYRDTSSDLKYGTISFKMRSKKPSWQESLVCVFDRSEVVRIVSMVCNFTLSA